MFTTVYSDGKGGVGLLLTSDGLTRVLARVIRRHTVQRQPSTIDHRPLALNDDVTVPRPRDLDVVCDVTAHDAPQSHVVAAREVGDVIGRRQGNGELTCTQRQIPVTPVNSDIVSVSSVSILSALLVLSERCFVPSQTAVPCSRILPRTFFGGLYADWRIINFWNS